MDIPYDVLSENRKSLETALKDNYVIVTEDLRKEGLLKADIYRILKDPRIHAYTSDDKACLIVNSVLEYVQLQPANFHKFLEVLKKNENQFVDIIEELEKAFTGKSISIQDVKKKLIEQLDPLKKIEQSLSQAVKEVKNAKSEIEAQRCFLAKEIENSFEELHKILEKRKQELLKEAEMEVTHKLECLCVQEKSLSTSCAVIKGVIEDTEQCVEHSTDDEVMRMHVELESQIEAEMKKHGEEKNLEPVEEADMKVEVKYKELEQLFQTKAKVIQLPIDLTKCSVTGEGAKSAEIGKLASFSVITKLNNGRLTKQECALDCRLKSLMTGSIVQCKLVKREKCGQYHVQYTPTVHGDHELIVTVNGEAVAVSPIPVCVSIHPTQLGKPVKILSGLKNPFDVAVNSDGEIIITEHNGDVVMFDRGGRRLRNVQQSFFNLSKLAGVAVDKEDNIYFVHKQTGYFTQNKQYIVSKTNKKMENISGEKSKHKSSDEYGYVAVVGDEVMLSASNSHTTIEVYNTSLKYIREITPHGPLKLDLNGISSDEDGTLYVSDFDNKSIRVLSNDGKFLHSIACDQLSGPGGLCVAGQYVYVSEYDAHKISVYTREGKYVASFGRKGSGEGEFARPVGVYVDKHGLVYVCDRDNNRVQIF